VSAAATRLLEGRHHAPFEVLGAHRDGDAVTVRVFLPEARRVWVTDAAGAQLELTSAAGSGSLFEWRGPAAAVPAHYRVSWQDARGHTHHYLDPYTFPAEPAAAALQRFAGGSDDAAYLTLGSHPMAIDGVAGVRFAVWAPNAERVSLMGDHNGWDARRQPMHALGSSGVWSLFVPELAPGARYKYDVRSRITGRAVEKADPYAQSFELRPRSASLVAAPSAHRWHDDDWLERRDAGSCLERPMSVYEVHPGSWRRGADGFLNYRDLAVQLAEHVTSLGFTHVELMPITEHPFDGSWGYQTLGYFAATKRFGEADDLRWFVDYLHRHGVGVILDWVPGHFPNDDHGLAAFDGSALYEHEDPRRGFHQEWNTLIFNYGRNEVRSFLTSSALYWLREFHFDGLRVDAVASMLYLDYARKPGEWLPNRYGGNENLEAIDWIRELNEQVHGEFPGAAVIAEESTAWPQVTRPTYVGGLGFTLKWNMGWMHDTLSYLTQDPVHRSYHHDRLTFGMLYADTENFLLPLSHDEVVHGKGSLLHKMPGDDWQKFANLRLLYCYQFTYPGKKLLFMGQEFAQRDEWNHDRALDWHLLEHASHRGVSDLLRDLNALYRRHSALNADGAGGFEWIDCHDAPQSVVSYLRRSGDSWVLVVLNFTPVPRHGYRLGVPAAGRYRELLNSDAQRYGGSNLGNLGAVPSEAVAHMGRPHSLVLTLPPLAALVLGLED
jgi:1,4-alpha-glucan branching enzyme